MTGRRNPFCIDTSPHICEDFDCDGEPNKNLIPDGLRCARCKQLLDKDEWFLTTVPMGAWEAQAIVAECGFENKQGGYCGVMNYLVRVEPRKTPLLWRRGHVDVYRAKSKRITWAKQEYIIWA